MERRRKNQEKIRSTMQSVPDRAGMRLRILEPRTQHSPATRSTGSDQPETCPQMGIKPGGIITLPKMAHAGPPGRLKKRVAGLDEELWPSERPA
jgi:hypothetical protein